MPLVEPNDSSMSKPLLSSMSPIHPTTPSSIVFQEEGLNQEGPPQESQLVCNDDDTQSESSTIHCSQASMNGQVESVESEVEPAMDDELVCIAPSDVEVFKYHRFTYYSPSEGSIEVIPPLQQTFVCDRIPSDWKEYVGPEGNLYYVHKILPAVTLTDIQDSDNCRRINAAVQTLTQRMREANLLEDVELVVMCTWQKNEPVLGYYLVNWTRKSVFWFSKVEHNIVTQAVRSPVSQAHLGLAIQEQFYLNMEIFPCHHPLPVAMVKELRQTYNYAIIDVLTSDTTMFSYDLDISSRVAKVMEGLKDEDVDAPETVWIVGRMLKTLYRDRFLAYFGEPAARIDRHDSAWTSEIHESRSILFLLASPFFFFLPSVYLKELELVFIDMTVHYAAWRRLIASVKRDWEASTTPALVLLAADIPLLILQSFENQGSTKNVGQIAAYISALLSLSVYVSCQILIRRHRHSKSEQAEGALDFLSTRADRVFGFPCIAVAFSLPAVFLIWSIIAFVVSMMYACFNQSNLATQIALGTTLGILALLLAALVYMEWETDRVSPKLGFKLCWADVSQYFKSIRPRWNWRKTSNGDTSKGAEGNGTMTSDASLQV